MDIISILTTLINLCLIVAVWKIKKSRKINLEYYDIVSNRRFESRMAALRRFVEKETERAVGETSKYYISAKIAEKMSEKAFNMASAANLGVVALQRTLQMPRLMTKEQGIKNALANKQINELFDSEGSGFDYLRPILTDEELDVLDEIEKKKKRERLEENAIPNGEY